MIKKTGGMLYPEDGDTLEERIAYLLWKKTYLGSVMSIGLAEDIIKEVEKEYGQTTK